MLCGNHAIMSSSDHVITQLKHHVIVSSRNRTIKHDLSFELVSLVFSYEKKNCCNLHTTFLVWLQFKYMISIKNENMQVKKNTANSL